MALQLRRGTEADRASFTPKEGELVYVTDTNRLYVGGKVSPSTDLEVGGILVTGKLSEDTTPQLSGNLNLNNNDIIGTGNININGTITATGNINLGDGAEDNVIVGGQISSSLIPGSSGLYDLGDNAGRWREVHALSVNAQGLSVNGEASVGSLAIAGDIKDADSTVIFDGATKSLTVSSVTSNAFIGNLEGSVNAYDSTVLLDATNNTLYADVDNNLTRASSLEGATIVLEGYNVDNARAGIRINTDGNETDGYDLFTISGAVDSSEGPTMFYNRSRGTHANPLPVQNGDTILGHLFVGNDADNNPALVGGFNVTVDGDPVSGGIPGQFNIVTGNVNGLPNYALSINSEGHSLFSGAVKLATYANEAARDAAIPTPQAGMVILLTGHDDSTGGPVFQGYDGNDWRDFT